MPVESVVDATIGVVVVDLPCRKCGYNVRGMSPAGVCPECGTRVALSLQEDLLRFCDPKWVRTLHRGVRFLLWAIVLMVLSTILGIGLHAAGLERLAGFVLHGAMLAVAAVAFVGSWWLTEPDPSGLGEDRYGAVRKLIRVTLLLSVVETMLDLVVEFAGPLPPWLRLTTQAVGLVLQLAGLVGLLATLQYVRRLSLRIPDVALSRRAHFLTFSLGICYGMFLLITAAVDLFAGRAGAAPAALAIGCAMVPVGLALLVFGVMYLVLTIQLGRRLAEQATIAERAWLDPAVSTRPSHP